MTLDTAIGGLKSRLPHDFGYRVWALGIMALGVAGLLMGDFVSGQPAPKWLPYRTELAYAAGGFMLLAGAAAQWRRAIVWAAGAITAYYAIIVVLLMDGRIILRHAGEFQAYNGTCEQVALAAAGLVVFASHAPRIDPDLAARLIAWSRRVFGACAILFGVAHFLYMNLTAPIVPGWLPPSQEFWGYATGVFHILGGLALISGVQARLAAILLTIMYAAFTPLVHLPLLFGDPHNHFFWSENAVNIALAGSAWVMADSLARPQGK